MGFALKIIAIMAFVNPQSIAAVHTNSNLGECMDFPSRLIDSCVRIDFSLEVDFSIKADFSLLAIKSSHLQGVLSFSATKQNKNKERCAD